MSLSIRYVPGPWIAMVRSGHMLLLPGETAAAELDGLWDALGESPSVESLLSAVLSGRGLSLTGMPPFGILAMDEDLHVILRGPLSLSSSGRELSTHVNGMGVTTWMERRLTRQEHLTVATDESARSSSEDVVGGLPLVEGVVQFGRLTARLPAPCDNGVIEPLSTPTPVVAAAEHPSAVQESERFPESAPAPEPVSAPAPEPPPADEAPTEPTVDGVSEDTTAFHGDSDDRAEIGDTMVTADDAEEENTILSPSAAGAASVSKPSVVPPPASVPSVPQPSAHAQPASPAERAAPDGAASPDELQVIDAVPWFAAARATAAPAIAPVFAPSADVSGVRVPGAAETGEHDNFDDLGDHDGHTLMRGDLVDVPEVSAPHPAGLAEHAPAGGVDGPMVLGRVCESGHSNPPTSSNCGRCGAQLGSEALPTPRPSLGRMLMSTGESVELDRSAVVGRQPSIARVGSGTMPRVIQVKSPSGDISRSHLEVRLDGWHVMLVDLNATNGTMLVRPGQSPRRLGKGESLMLLDGDIADLGDGVSLRFEGLL